MRNCVMICVIVAIALSACGRGGTSEEIADGFPSFALTSPAFAQEGDIPAKHTCDGDDISPPLAWGAPPAGTLTLALICDDPDAPAGTWVHWVLFDIPGSMRELREGVAVGETLPDGSQQGSNSSRLDGYSGPCPPSGTHRYYFKLYALDTTLELGKRTTKADLLAAMEGHILGQAELMGKYHRKSS
jgi:Raf kinase inhibitor-like YbhB/YbcL family protein